MRRSVIAVAAVAAVGVGLAVPHGVGNGPTARADDTPGQSVGGDTANSAELQLIYRAFAKKPPLPPTGMVKIPMLDGFILDAEQQMWLELEAEQQRAKREEYLRLVDQAIARIRQKMAADKVRMSSTNDELFANWTFEDGSGIAQGGGEDSVTSPTADNSFQLTQTGEGSIHAEYGARATIDGNSTQVNGSLGFDANILGLSRLTGFMGLSSTISLTPEDGEDGPKLKLDGNIRIDHPGKYTASVGSTSFGVGMVGMSADGHQIGASVAVGADGELLGISVGGVVQIPGLPSTTLIRVDLGSTGASFSTDPVPGVSVTGNTDGTFQLTVNVETFYPWFNKIVSGD